MLGNPICDLHHDMCKIGGFSCGKCHEHKPAVTDLSKLSVLQSHQNLCCLKLVINAQTDVFEATRVDH